MAFSQKTSMRRTEPSTRLRRIVYIPTNFALAVYASPKLNWPRSSPPPAKPPAPLPYRPHTIAPHAPVIELNGNASSTIDIGDTYNDLGARIVAPESDLNLGIVIVLDGATTTEVSIDTTAPGEHTILYTVTSPTTGLTSSTSAPSPSPLPNNRQSHPRTTIHSMQRLPTTMLPRQQLSILPPDRVMTIEADDPSVAVSQHH